MDRDGSVGAFFVFIIILIITIFAIWGIRKCASCCAEDEYTQQEKADIDKSGIKQEKSSSPLGSDNEKPIETRKPELKLVYSSDSDEMAGKVVKGPTLIGQSLLKLRSMNVQRYGDNQEVIVLLDSEFEVPYNNMVKFRKVVGGDGSQFYLAIKDDPNIPSEALPQKGQTPAQSLRVVEPKDIDYPTEAMPDVVQPDTRKGGE